MTETKEREREEEMKTKGDNEGDRSSNTEQLRLQRKESALVERHSWVAMSRHSSNWLTPESVCVCVCWCVSVCKCW